MNITCSPDKLNGPKPQDSGASTGQDPTGWAEHKEPSIYWLVEVTRAQKSDNWQGVRVCL